MTNSIMKFAHAIPRLQYMVFVVLFCLTPFLMSSRTSEIFEFNKMMFVYTSAVLSLGLWCSGLYVGVYQWRQIPWIISAMFVFLLTNSISTIFSIDFHTSVFGYYGRWNGGLLSIIAYLSLSVVASQTLDRSTMMRILKYSIVASCLVMVWGLAARYGRDPSCLLFTGVWDNGCWTDQFRPAERMFATIGQPNWLGAYLVFHFFPAAYFWQKHTVYEQKDQGNWSLRWNMYSILYGLYLFSIVTCVFFTRSRSSLLALLIGIAVLGGVFLLKKKKWLMIYILVGLASVSVVLWLLFGSARSFLYEAPGVNQQITSSADIRKVVWQGAWNLTKLYPVFGSGVETFGYAYYETRPREHNDTSEWDFLYNKAHNELLHYAATTGFTGAASYMSMIIVVIGMTIASLVRVYRIKGQFFDRIELYLVLAYFSLTFIHFFGFSTSLSNLFFFLLPSFLFLTQNVHHSHPADMPSGKSCRTFVAGILTIGTITLSGIWYVVQYYRADILYAKGKNSIAASDYVNAMRYLSDALKVRYEHVYEDKLSQALAYLAYEISLRNPEGAKGIITLSEAANTKALRASPRNIVYRKSKARNQFLYYQATKKFGYLLAAEQAMKEAVVFAPTDAQTRYALAVIYDTLMQETKNARQRSVYQADYIRTLDEVLILRPQYLEALQAKQAMLE